VKNDFFNSLIKLLCHYVRKILILKSKILNAFYYSIKCFFISCDCFFDDILAHSLFSLDINDGLSIIMKEVKMRQFIGVMFLLFINPFFLWSYSEIRYPIDQYRVMAITSPL
jgi:hypothetical protein